MTWITKALIVDQPWIDLILSGKKTWEMRGTSTSFRGWFGLIRKSSGQVVGAARLTGVGQALSTEQMVATIERHHIPEQIIRSGTVSKWTTPWHLASARPLLRPVAYRHPSGAVTWVNLEDSVAQAVSDQLGLTADPAPRQPEPRPVLRAEPSRPAPVRPAPAVASPSPLQPNTMLGETEVTEGNLKNNHFYLRGFLHHFPEQLVGGRNLDPPTLALVEAEGMPPTWTDICPRHRFFRDRSWTRQLFANQDSAPGDRVQVHQIAPLHYRVSIVKG
ncbi:MAG: ASCH domain-containing protein [Rhodobacteraceae bacterium]|nr:ASCH domain-containing protein [Paracoccaceae bacterium]